MPVDVANLHVVIHPDPVLRVRASEIRAITDEIHAVAQRMIELMKLEEGIGLAATQVGLPWRLFVAHVPEEPGRRSADSTPVTATRAPRTYINPVLSAPAGDIVAHEEGCLSLPDIRGDVLRPEIVTLTYQTLDGQTCVETGAGLLARCWQHEVDHLDGVLIIDRMTQMSRLKVRSAVRDLERGASRPTSGRSSRLQS